MARSSSRHVTRRHRRLTPRRWPVLLVIPALLVGAGIVDRDHDRDDPSSGTSSTTQDLAALQPTASSKRSLSSTFFCAGGTARGEDGPAELSVVVSNVSDEPVTGSVTVYGDKGESGSEDIEVPARGKVTVDASTVAEARWAAAQVEVFGGQVSVERRVDGPLGVDSGPCSSAASASWTVPSGATIRGSNEQLALFNPYADDATVDIRFVSDAGVRTPRALQGYQVPARSLRLVNVTSVVARRPTVTSLVTARAGQVVVDRVQLDDGTGDDVQSAGGEGEGGPVTDPAEGLTVTAGMPSSALTWFFPDIVKREGGRTRLVIFNPSSSAADVDIQVDLDDPERNGELSPFELTIEPRDVQVFDITAQDPIPEVGSTATVRSVNGQPVYAELTYASGEPSAARDTTATPGAPTAATSWMFGQATVTGDDSGRIAVMNPGATTARLTKVERLGPDGPTSLEDIEGREIAPGARTTFQLPESDEDDSVLLITADRPVVAQSWLVSDSTSLASAMGVPLPEGLVLAPAGS